MPLSHRLLITAIVFGNLLFWSSQAHAQIPSAVKIKSREVGKSLNKFNKDRSQLDESYLDFLKDLNDKYEKAIQLAQSKLRDSLEAVRKEATQSDKLNEAVLMQKAIEEVEDLPTSPKFAQYRRLNPTAKPDIAQASSGSPLASMTVADYQKAMLGKWNRTDGLVFDYRADGTLVVRYPDGKALDNDVSYHYRDGAVFICMTRGQNFFVYRTTDFVTIHSIYSDKIKLHRAEN